MRVPTGMTVCVCVCVSLLRTGEREKGREREVSERKRRGEMKSLSQGGRIQHNVILTFKFSRTDRLGGLVVRCMPLQFEIEGSNPAFFDRVIPVTEKLVHWWLPCQMPMLYSQC